LIYLLQGQAASAMTCFQLHKKAERIGAMLIDKARVNTGDHVALIYPPGLDLIAAFYGCLYVGLYYQVVAVNSLMMHS
jgi:acyl-CoA synthetase (AMP-forming)/AMP-acid ligase II